MKKLLNYLLIFTLSGGLLASVNNQPEIKLAGAKDLVLSPEVRASVLEIAEASLNRSDDAFITTIEKVENPYSTDEEALALIKESTDDKLSVVYDDASILEVIEVNFAAQVRGILAKGETYYLQLNGGAMLQAGATFLAEVPQIEGQSFTVTILEVDSRGYTLKMNDVMQRVTFEKPSNITKDF